MRDPQSRLACASEKSASASSDMKLFSNAVRGFLIGVAEVIPGVSGGTIALVVGIYERILEQVANFTKSIFGIRQGIASLKRLSKLDWPLILPMLGGMVVAILVGASVLEPLLETQREIMFALFAGLILASIYVPFQMLGRWSGQHYLLGLVGATIAFSLTSLPRAASQDPQLPAVFLVAMIAVCALVLPGVSGSFFLLAVGMYQPTIAAVNDRDFGYLGVFALGAIAGLMSFAIVMQFLLARYRAATLAVMTGLMLGSLRALWPWQDENSQLLNPTEPLFPLIAFGSGIAIVVALIVVEARLKANSNQ